MVHSPMAAGRIGCLEITVMIIENREYSYVDALSPNMIVLEMGLGKVIWCRWAPHDGVSALIENTPGCLFSVSLLREDTARRGHL